MASRFLECELLSPHAILPVYGSPSAIGLDLHAVVVDLTGVKYSKRIPPGDRALIQTGIAVALPDGYYGRIAPRSGLAVRNGIDVLAGVIDADYRGEIGIVLLNTGSNDFWVKTGDRIAQLILERADRVDFVISSPALPNTARGSAGFGSTGV